MTGPARRIRPLAGRLYRQPRRFLLTPSVQNPRRGEDRAEAEGGDGGGDRPNVRIALLDRDDPGADEDDAERSADEALRRLAREGGADHDAWDRADQDVGGKTEV